MAASAFALLSGGARFNKARFQQDMDLFQPHKPRDKGKARATPDASDSESVSTPPSQQKISLSGPDLPKSLHASLLSLVSHETSPLDSDTARPLLRALKDASIQSLWGVQCAVGGCMLQGRDVMCVAPTGSGKTLAYVLPTLVRLGRPAKRLAKGETGVRAAVVVPTHDLAVQIAGVVKAVTVGRPWRCLVLSKATEVAVCQASPGEVGGGDPAGEGSSTALGVDILISTPERLHHLLSEGRVSLAKWVSGLDYPSLTH